MKTNRQHQPYPTTARRKPRRGSLIDRRCAAIASVPEFVVRKTPHNDDCEIIAGLWYPLPRPSKAHEAVCAHIEKVLREHLACSMEQVFTLADRRPLCTDDSTLYPDFWISTLSKDPVADQRVAFPSVVIEVLAPAREKVDRADKLHAYRSIPSVQELIVVDTKRRRSEKYVRIGENTWEFSEVHSEDRIYIEAVACAFDPFELCGAGST